MNVAPHLHANERTTIMQQCKSHRTIRLFKNKALRNKDNFQKNSREWCRNLTHSQDLQLPSNLAMI